MSATSSRLPVVFLHGWPVTQDHWRHLSPRLVDAGFAPTAISLPGLGVPATGVSSFRKAHLAARLREELNGLGVTRFALVGHDWGATVALLLAAAAPDSVVGLVVEEEIAPGVDVEIPEPGTAHYPSWHGPFNRVPGLADTLVPGREDAYYGTFLKESAGPAGLDESVQRSYIDAYRAEEVLEAGLGYYRTRADDVTDVNRLRSDPVAVPVLAVGGRYAMGSAVVEGLRPLATNVSGVVLDRSGHYPVEQEPEQAGRAVVAFLEHLRSVEAGPFRRASDGPV
ncbi:MAG: alpha/beta hydrolase [Gordonia sp. (in: high G+C Gram-positive bacteria)]|jgi:pimeloyl-ACP methyl ester carboxylesterase|nr:alpha/beta hydrolase [Gordonia sp. (in: high G+C Gram-positive bacteria)]